MTDINQEGGSLPDVDTLAIVADWRVDLSTRLKRAELRHAMIGVSPEEIAALGDEARDFTRLVKVLKAVVQ